MFTKTNPLKAKYDYFEGTNFWPTIWTLSTTVFNIALNADMNSDNLLQTEVTFFYWTFIYNRVLANGKFHLQGLKKLWGTRVERE